MTIKFNNKNDITIKDIKDNIDFSLNSYTAKERHILLEQPSFLEDILSLYNSIKDVSAKHNIDFDKDYELDKAIVSVAAKYRNVLIEQQERE